MKAFSYLFVLLLAVGLMACKDNKPTFADGDADSTQMMEGSDEETQRFLNEEGDIVRDGDTTDYSRVPEDLPDEEDSETNLPAIEEN